MRMCRICDANPVASDGMCMACMKDAAGPLAPARQGARRAHTPRGVRTSTPSWVRPRKEAVQALAADGGTEPERA